MYKPLVIGVDLDGICVELDKAWCAAYNKDHAEAYGVLTPASFTHWNAVAETPIGRKMYEYLHVPGFFRGLPPVPGAVAALKKLAEKGHRIVIATACAAIGHAPEKMEWVKEHLPFVNRKDVFFGVNKELLAFDVFIDDAPHNLIAYRKRWPEAKIATIAYPYNQNTIGTVDLYASDSNNTEKAWKTIVSAIYHWSRPTSYLPGIDCDEEEE